MTEDHKDERIDSLLSIINEVTRGDNKSCWRSALKIGAVLLLLAVCILPFPAAAAENARKKATLMPLWSPQAQFAGYYVALDKGIYTRNGIDMTILKGGAGHVPEQILLDGKADFAILWLTTAMQQRATGGKLINVAQLVQRSSMMLISKKSAGIRSVADMNGKKIGLWGGDLSIPPRILFAKHSVKVREVPQSTTVNLFLRGGIDVTSAMRYNEYHTILNSGVDPEELNVLSLNELGVNFPEDGIYTREQVLRKDPALVDSFVAASLEGWRYAFDHPDEALDIVIKYMRDAQLSANRMHQKWMLEQMRDLIMPGSAQGSPGLLREQDYQAVGSALRKAGLLNVYPDYKVFTWRSDAGKK